jgi:hypothetical protein
MSSETPQIQPIQPSYYLRILSDRQLADFKSATLEILDEVGFHCPSRMPSKPNSSESSRPRRVN